MAYVPLNVADLAPNKPVRGTSFGLRTHNNFEDHQSRLNLLELGTTAATVTTVGNIDALAPAGATHLRMNNATLATIRGIVAPTAGQPRILVITSVGAGQVNLAHQHATPTAANRIINFATIGDTPMAAGSGVAILRYDDTTLRWRLVHHEQGAWITVPYVAGNFTGSGTMTWTVDSADQATFKYKLLGKTLHVLIFIVDSTVGGTPTATLLVAVPAGFLLDSTAESPTVGEVIDNGAGVLGVMARNTDALFKVQRFDKANWALAVNTTRVFFGGLFAIQ